MSGSKLEKLEALMEEASQKHDICMMLLIHGEMKKIKGRENMK